jgi:tripartite-type tricarboxylate transporter receptor subunit TctC
MQVIARLVVSMLGIGTSTAGITPALCDSYPSKPVRIVTSEVGGSTDLSARLLGQGIAALLGQPVVVENRGGGGGIITIETVQNALPDGYTLLFYGSGLWTLPLLQSAPYNPKDFVPISLATEAPNIIAVSPALQVSTVADLIALAKANPGRLNYASGPTGSSSHLAPELFKFMSGVDIVRIPYKGAGPAINAVVGGEAQLMFSAAGTAAPHIKSGRVKALAVTSLAPSALFPGMPTVAASGLPGFESTSTQGLFAPRRTPAVVIRRLNADAVAVLRQPEVKGKLLTLGVEAVGTSTEQFDSRISSEVNRLGKMIRSTGIRAE